MIEALVAMAVVAVSITRRVRRVGIRPAARSDDVEAKEHVNARHRLKLAGLNALQDFLIGMVEDVVVFPVAASLLRRAGLAFPARRRVEVAGFSTMACVPVSNESIASLKVGGPAAW